ncbi:hypothetical protein [Portibacter lacus]|uniref:Uncharacterized protein n=1 Tax=Portibacter lacus TaxID=1099794 RepID=A0AA37SQK5_9BACT|nr:hypothetical protein [Portibacter lacus]GLR18257.1 hypothetical protein GCM10007940_28730 [Portibacter lacus]
MSFQNNKNFQFGFILVMLSVGVKIATDTYDLGIYLNILSGLMALIGFLLMIKGIYDSKKKSKTGS